MEEIKTEYDMEEEGIKMSTCTNCCSIDKRENLLKRLIVTTEDESQDSGTTVHEAVSVIFGSELLRFDCNNPVLCVDCCEILTQLYNFYNKFKDRNQNGSDVKIAIARVMDRRYVPNNFQGNIPLNMHDTEYFQPPDLQAHSRICDIIPQNVDDDERLRSHRKRALQRKLKRRQVNADQEMPPPPQSPEITFVETEARNNEPKLQSFEKCNTRQGREESCTEDEVGNDVTSDVSFLKIKRGRGRPKKAFTAKSANPTFQKKRGRPKKVDISPGLESQTELERDPHCVSKDTPNDESDVDGESDVELESTSKSKSPTTPGNRGRGRPKGSKNGVSYLDKKSRKHICPHCGKVAKTARNIFLHIRGVHEGQRPYACSLCPKRFAGNDGLANHMRVFHADPTTGNGNVKQFVCSVDGCGKSFSYRSSLLGHALAHDRQLWKFECDLCCRKCKTLTELDIHKQKHLETSKGSEVEGEVEPASIFNSISPTNPGNRGRGRPKGSKNGVSYVDTNSRKHICPHCGKVAKTARNIFLHIRGVHEGQRPYECPSCPKRFAGNDGLANHLRIFHADSTTLVKPFVCPVIGCHKAFAYPSSLFGHALVHDRTLWKFQCDICGRKCKSSTELAVHKSSHSEVRNFSCEDCGVLFKRKLSLRQHHRFHHPEKYGGVPIAKLTCHICQKKFITPGNTRQHIRNVHQKIKPFRCSLCEKQFSFTGNLKVHLKGFHSLDGSDFATEFSKCRILSTKSEVDRHC